MNSAPSDQRRIAVGAYLFAEDWSGARRAVERDGWLLSDEAAETLAIVASEGEELGRMDPEMAEILPLIALARERLAIARTAGTAVAFGDLAALDERLKALTRADRIGAVVLRMRDDPSLLEDRGGEALRGLNQRAGVRNDEDLGSRIERVFNIVQLCRAEGIGAVAAAAASEIAAALRMVEPQAANDADLQACEEAVELLRDETGTPLWRELQVRFGSYLLEKKTGNRAENVARAREAYRTVLASCSRESELNDWIVAASGLANSLASDPARDRRTLEEAFRLYEDVISACETAGGREALVSCLGNFAAALVAAPLGGRLERMEYALALQRRVVRLLSGEQNPEAWDPARWSRAAYKLGTYYLRRERGTPSSNTDSAILALRDALSGQSEDLRARARTLRALASAYPGWSAPESLAKALALAGQAAAEADRIDPEGAAIVYSSDPSALDTDLEWLEEQAIPARISWLNAEIARHQSVLAVIPRATLPVDWARWKGGLGRLLALSDQICRAEQGEQALACFRDALEAISPQSHPLLWREIQRRLGELCHRTGDWSGSLAAHGAALKIADTLFDEADTPDGQRKELLSARGFALFGCYAAARLGRLDEAVAMAEAGRARGFSEAMAVVELRFRRHAGSQYIEVDDARREVARLESELNAIADPSKEAEGLLARFADATGGDLGMVKMRVVSHGPWDRDTTIDEAPRLFGQLRRARARLREAVARARAEAPDVLPRDLSASELSKVAADAGYPIVYLLATMHGALGLGVLPDGPVEAVPIDVTSDDTLEWVFGRNASAPHVFWAMYGDEQAAGAPLDGLLATLRERVIAPVTAWISGHGYGRAALIPLGRLGILPLHAAAGADGPALSYAPSVRALRVALASAGRNTGDGRAILAVGEPARNDEAPLPCAVGEVRAIESLFGGKGQATVLPGAAATREAVINGAPGATHLHLACHARFRPSTPLESSLLLAGKDELTLRDLLSGVLDLSAVRLVALSACQTANVEQQTPDEVLGFPTGVLLAGAPGVVSTLWPVDDRAAALFFQEFYRLCLEEGHGHAAAVAKAQQWLRTECADELADRVDSLQATLVQGDRDSDRALSALWKDLVTSGVNPFAGARHWAVFCYTGA